MVDDLKSKELIVLLIDDENEVKTGIATEDKLQVLSPFDEVAETRRPSGDRRSHVAQQARTLLSREYVVVLRETYLSLSVAQNHSLYLSATTHKK